MILCTYGPAERKRQGQISDGRTSVVAVQRSGRVGRGRWVAAHGERVATQDGGGDVSKRTVVHVRVVLLMIECHHGHHRVVVAAVHPAVGRPRCRRGHRGLVLILAQAQLEQGVALRRARALQRHRWLGS